MTVPTSYTELTLAQFMHTKLGAVATAMAYAAPTSNAGVYQEAVNDVLIAYGVSDIAEATDIPKLRTFAEREAWRKVVTESAAHYDVASDEQSFKRSQLFAQAKQNFELADAEAKTYAEADDSYTLEIVPVASAAASVVNNE